MTTDESTTYKATVKAVTLAAVLADADLFASSASKDRPMLRGVLLTAAKERGQVVSTDSYGMGIFTFDAEGSMHALIDTDDVRRIVTLAKAQVKVQGGGAPIVLERDGDTLTVRSYNETLTARIVPADFPNWRQLVSVPVLGGGVVSMTPRFVERMAKVKLGTTTRDRSFALTIHATDNLKPWHFYASANGITFRGLLMPVRTAGEHAATFETVEEVKP